MVLQKLRQAVGFAKDFASIGKAWVRKYWDEKDFHDLEIAVLRATNHYQTQIDGRAMDHIHLRFSVHPESVYFLVGWISRRLNKTRDRVVVLKTLFLVHGILRGNRQLHVARAFDHLLANSFWFMRNTDLSSAFLRNYADYLRERSGWIVNQSGSLEPIKINGDGSRSSDPVFNISKCNDLVKKVLNCSPGDVRPRDNLAQAAFCTILEESFEVYNETYTRETEALSNMLSAMSRPARSVARAMLEESAQRCRYLSEFYRNSRGSVGDKNLKYPSVEFMNKGSTSTNSEKAKAMERRGEEETESCLELNRSSFSYDTALSSPVWDKDHHHNLFDFTKEEESNSMDVDRFFQRKLQEIQLENNTF